MPPGIREALGPMEAVPPVLHAAAGEDAKAGTWAVGLVGTRPNAPHRYTLVFEPFEGRLLGLVRR